MPEQNANYISLFLMLQVRVGFLLQGFAALVGPDLFRVSELSRPGGDYGIAVTRTTPGSRAIETP
jgi:hypothetical protein